MANKQKQAQARIELALFQSRQPIVSEDVDAFAVIDDWFAVADHDIPHIYGTASSPLELPRTILTAAVIGIVSMPVLVIRTLNGCYRLGLPAGTDSRIPAVTEERRKGRISWIRFQRMIEAFVARLSEVAEGM